MRPTHAGLLLAAAASLAACSKDATSPSTNTTPTTISASASTYLKNALDFEQSVFLYYRQINWPTMRSDVVTKAGAAQKPADTYDAIDYSIDHYFLPLGDRHSAFFRPSDAPGRVDSPSNNPLYLVQGQMIGNVAYLYVPTFDGKNPVGRADSTLAMIKQLDASKPCGWIVDLRNNPGGTWASMLSGINPIIGDGQFAGLVDGDNNKAYFYVQGGEAGIYDPSSQKNYPQVKTSTTYTLSHPNAPVALLQGPLTASAGELIVLGFKGAPMAVRTFGTSTYGVTTVPAGTYLPPDSAYLNITAAVMFDRTGKTYGDVITPDQLIPSDTTVVNPPGRRDLSTNAALAWLASRPECGGTATSQALAPSAHFNAAAMPQRTAPRTRPLSVSPYFVGSAGTTLPR
jgi:carboxyl-terminal processing protease